MSLFPLPWSCQRLAWSAGPEDDYGNVTPTWLAPVSVPCVWWSPETQSASSEPELAPTGGDRALVDLVLVVAAGQPVDHRDRFIVDGHQFEVFGLPKDYNHGPFGFSPDRIVIDLRAVI